MISSRAQTLAAAALLATLTLLAYHKVTANGFVDFDDIELLFKTTLIYEGLSLTSLSRILTTPLMGNWIPLTALSHMTDITLFGTRPAGHHLMNLLIHMCNVLLLFLVLSRMSGSFRKSFLVAALFALHPVNVESVAWISERKNLLSTMFLFLTIHFYTEYSATRSRVCYIWALLFFLCGLSSKPMLVSLPFVLLIIDLWPLKPSEHDSRGTKLRLVEKIPFLLPAAAAGTLTLIFQYNAGAIKDPGLQPLILNSMHASANYIRYLFIGLWPTDLAVLYPYRQTLPLWQPTVSIVLLISLTFLAYRLRSTRPYLIFGWLWFLVTITPVAGFIRIGAHSVADRYAYVPLIGIFVIAVWSAADALATARNRLVVAVPALLLLSGLLISATYRQVAVWKDSITLFTHAISVTRGNWLAHNNIAVELIKRGELAAAHEHIRESLRINPDYADAHYNLGKILTNLGDTQKAIEAYRKAVTIDPSNADAFEKLSLLYYSLGDRKLSEFMFQTAERLRSGASRNVRGIN